MLLLMKFFVGISSLFQSSLPNQICKNASFGLKKYRKGRQEWNKACLDLNLPLRKLNTPMKIR
jgi:hypothetical protein